jgi:hypothetical protein
MNKIALVFVSLAAVSAALTMPEPAQAEHLGYAKQWMAKRFQRSPSPGSQLRPQAQQNRPKGSVSERRQLRAYAGAR